MSKIVAVHPSYKDISDSGLDKRQISLTVEDCPKLVVQFDDILTTCQACERELIKSCGSNGKTNSIELKQQQQLKKDYQSFLSKYLQLVSPTSSTARNDSDTCLKRTSSTSSLTSSTSSSTTSTSASSSPLQSPNPPLSSSSVSSTDHHQAVMSASIDQKFVLEAKQADLLNTISQVVTCIGCKTSVERFYRQLIQQQQHHQQRGSYGKNESPVTSTHKVLDPIIVNSNGSLTLKQSFTDKPTSVYSLFYLNKLLEFIPKIKKNRRCHLHSLDTQKQRTLNDWFYVWEALGTNECRKKAIAIESRQLSITLENYLRKHKFCGDCKMKVVRAYQILLGEVDPTKEKGFCSSLYSGIQCCLGTHSLAATSSPVSSSQTVSSREKLAPNQHIHINCDKQFIMNLILKAEPEIHGSRRERHAKTIDIAQEEVLTCIGLYIYERFHRIYQVMKAEEQTWQILFYASILTLKKSFELEFERRSGVSKLELLCAELAALDSNTNGSSSNSSLSSSKSKKKQKKSTSQIKSAKKKEQRHQKASSIEKIENERTKAEYEMEDDEDDEMACQRIDEDSSSCSNSTGNLLVVETEIPGLDNGAEEEEEEIDDDDDEFDEELNYANDEAEAEHKIPPDSSSTGPSPASSSPFSLSSSSFTSSSYSSPSSSSTYRSSTSTFTNQHQTTPITAKAPSTRCECPNQNFEKTSSFGLDFVQFKTDDIYLNEENGGNDQDDGECLITDEEKNEYYANKSLLMNERLHRREILQQKFQMFKLNASNFKLRPRNVC